MVLLSCECVCVSAGSGVIAAVLTAPSPAEGVIRNLSTSQCTHTHTHTTRTRTHKKLGGVNTVVLCRGLLQTYNNNNNCVYLSISLPSFQPLSLCQSSPSRRNGFAGYNNISSAYQRRYWEGCGICVWEWREYSVQNIKNTFILLSCTPNFCPQNSLNSWGHGQETVERENLAVLQFLTHSNRCTWHLLPYLIQRHLKYFVLPIHPLNGRYTQSMSQLSQGLKILI
jgi:hypothetical protein